MLVEPIFRSGTAAIVVPERNWRTKAMRNVCKSVFLVCLVTWAASGFAQTTTSFPVFNFPPCDFNDNFYMVNGFDVTNLDLQAAGRFGTFRQFGPPAFQPGQANWVADGNCSVNDPNRRNFRILATTAAYKDDDGAPTQFLSIIAFVLNQNFFLTGSSALNARGLTVQDILGVLEAYVAPTQRVNGVLAPAPCGTMGDGFTPCFPVTSVATPNLRHDWRVSSNRNAIDGSSSDPRPTAPTSPGFSYFGDDLTGSWIVTYFWWTKFAVGGRPDKPRPPSFYRPKRPHLAGRKAKRMWGARTEARSGSFARPSSILATGRSRRMRSSTWCARTAARSTRASKQTSAACRAPGNSATSKARI